MDITPEKAVKLFKQWEDLTDKLSDRFIKLRGIPGAAWGFEILEITDEHVDLGWMQWDDRESASITWDELLEDDEARAERLRLAQEEQTRLANEREQIRLVNLEKMNRERLRELAALYPDELA